MKKLIIVGMVTSSILLNLNADALGTAKEYSNKAMVWKSEHLENIDYKTVYPKKLYQKSYFGLAVTSAAIVSAGAFTYFTAGVLYFLAFSTTQVRYISAASELKASSIS